MLRQSHTRSIVSFFSGSLAATALSMVATLMMMRWTPPEKFGLWNFALLAGTYISVFQLGVFNGLNRQLPYYEGQKRLEVAAQMADAAHAWCLALLTLSVAITAVLALLFLVLNQATDYIFTLFAIGAVVSCSWFLQFFTVLYSGASQFGALARKNVVTAAIGLPLVFLSYLLGYAGLLIRAAVMALLNIALLGRQRPFASKARWDIMSLKELSRIGFPIWGLGQLGALFMTLDRVVLAGSVVNLGLYSIAAQFAALAAMVPTSFNAVYYPQMARDYGSHHRALPLWRQAARVGIKSAMCGGVFAAGCWIAIPTFVQIVLPAYSPGIEAAQWAAIIGVVMAPSIFGNIFNLLGQQGVYLISSATGLSAFFLSWWVFRELMANPPLVSAAQSMLIGTLVSSLVSAVLAFAVCKRHDDKRDASGLASHGISE